MIRLRVALRVLLGRPVIYRAEFEYRPDTIMCVTNNALVAECVFRGVPVDIRPPFPEGEYALRRRRDLYRVARDKDHDGVV